MRQALRRLIPPIPALILAACTTGVPAPVQDRVVGTTGAPPAAQEATGESRPGFYAVKKGDTLYSIALEHGQDYKDVAAWNQLENAHVIKIGQVLRVLPPEGETPVAVVKPIVVPDALEVRPLGAPVANTDAFKREPTGGKKPYSEQAWADAQQGGGKPSIQVVKLESPAEARSDVAPIARIDPQPGAKRDAGPDLSAVASGEGGIDWSWPVAGKVLDGFVDGGNKGLDIGGNLGDPVLAAAAGKVLYAGEDLRGYGKLVVVKHDAAFLSVYAHNHQILVKEGQTVSRGQRIAELGKSDADQPKLHFEIRRQGKPVDPVKYLPAR